MKNYFDNNQHEIFAKYNNIRVLDETDKRIRYLVHEHDSKKLFILSIIRDGNIKIFNKLAKCDNFNITNFIDIKKIDNNDIVLIEDYFEDAITLQEHIGTGISINDFEDCILQICDVLIYLKSLKVPIVHNNINANNIIVCTGNVVKLINFENATFDGNCKNDIINFGELINNSGKIYEKRYRKVKDDCFNKYISPNEIQRGIYNSKRILGIRYAIITIIGVITMIILRVWHVYNRSDRMINRIIQK